MRNPFRKTIGLAFVLFGALFTSAEAETSQSDPGDYLLRAVKAVADSGRADDPATASALLHISFTRRSHSVWDQCPAGGHRVDDFYTVASNTWFHPLPTGKSHIIIQYLPQLIFNPNGKQTEAPLGDPAVSYDTRGVLSCAEPKQNEVSADINFTNIPAYACISEAQIKAIFPKLGGAPMVTDMAWGADFGYVPPDGGIVTFQMTLRPGVTDPHHQPVCLMNISLYSKSKYGPSHEQDISK